ncbi:NAD-dependent epimerase/dehydratase family protein [Streptomyces sp. NPDC052415]|uniref:NAD-dependent epimerase/dehydratase family protein n=1 Tax=Streptomyces sp. NPDC052415 TaxID=3365690 RepID=UPI0037CFC812
MILTPEGNRFAEATEVAVTGGSGFVGSHLVRALHKRGQKVVVVDLSAPRPDLLALPGVRYAKADLRDFGDVLLALQGTDTVFHLAGNASGTVSVERPRFDFEVNAVGTSNVGNASALLGVRKLVYLSSAIVYGTPRDTPMTEHHPTRPFLPYGASKLSGELALRSLHDTLGLPVVIGRSFVVYGPGEDPRRAGGEVSQFLRWQLNGLPIPLIGDRDRKTRDFIHVSDLCQALITLAEAGTDGEIYNLGSGHEVSMRELAHAVAEATGRPALLEADAGSLEDSFRLVADVSKLRGLGFTPEYDLASGLRDLAAHLGRHPELPSVTAVFRKTPVSGASAAVARATTEAEVTAC